MSKSQPFADGLMKLPWRIEAHFIDHGLLYLGAVVSLAVLGGFMFFADRIHSGRADKILEIRNWAEVEAVILESTLSEVDTSDETSFSTRIAAKVRFKYSTGNDTVTTDYVATWTRYDAKDWDAVLSPGKTIRIRVSPEDANTVSLFDHNVVP
jgi:hypothetical protein